MDDERASELAWQLAGQEVPPGNPLVFQREAVYREHLYWLIDQVSAHRSIWRIIDAGRSGRLIGELHLQRRWRRILKDGNQESVVLPELHRRIVEAEELSEKCWLGDHADLKTTAGLREISDASFRNRFARLVRRGAVIDQGPGTLNLRNEGGRKHAAYLLGLLVCAWLLPALWTMYRWGHDETFWVIGYLLGTAYLAAKFTRLALLDLKADTEVVAIAQRGLGPRPTDSARSSANASRGHLAQ
jgi:hypothetical protein